MTPKIEHPLVQETAEWWRESFNLFCVNPKERESEDFYMLSKTVHQLTEILEHLRTTLKHTQPTTSFWIEREMNLAFKNLRPDDEYQFTQNPKFERQK